MFGLVAEIIGYGVFETYISTKIGISFEIFLVIGYSLLGLFFIAFLITRKLSKSETPEASDSSKSVSISTKDHRRKANELFSEKSNLTDAGDPIKEYRGKTEKAFGIISLVCIALIIVVFLCVKLNFIGSETGFILIANGIFLGIIAIPVFIFRRLNRTKIFETKIILSPSARNVTISGKTQLYTKKIELDFTDIVSIDKKIITPRHFGENKNTVYVIKLSSGDMIEDYFSEFNEYQKQEIIVFLLERIKTNV